MRLGVARNGDEFSLKLGIQRLLHRSVKIIEIAVQNIHNNILEYLFYIVNGLNKKSLTEYNIR